MTAEIRAVLFDVDGVLVQPWRFRDHLIEAHAITPDMTAAFFRGPFGECVRGEARVEDVLPPFLEAWGWPGNVETFVETWLSVENAPDAAVLEIAERVRATGRPCYLASTQERNRARYLLEDMGFGELFDGSFFSCEVGVAKPAPDYYARVTERLGLPPEALLLIDDSAPIVQGALDAGWRAIHFENAAKLGESLERDFGIGGLDD